MGQISKTLPLNTDILKTCREQLALSLEDVKTKVGSINQIEAGTKRPTYKQLDALAQLYAVPRWVFISNTLPKLYHYAQKPSFRGLREQLQDSKARRLITRVEAYRDLFIELRNDLSDPVAPCTFPEIPQSSSIEESANTVIRWLGLEKPLAFEELKEKLEQRSVFIFLTSKYKSWSHIDKENGFRGLCLTHETMPIIIVNDSDAKKAQSFTLIHKLGHLLQAHTSIDHWQQGDSAEEKWCDRLAGNVLMSEKAIKQALPTVGEINSVKDIKKLATHFEVSPYACLVRLRQIGHINQQKYNRFEQSLQIEYEVQQRKLKEKNQGPARNRSREVRRQLGNAFVNTALTAWHGQELSLNKVMQIFDLKRAGQVLELEYG